MLRSPVTQQNRPKPESGLSGSSEGDKAPAPEIIQHGTKVWHGACRYGKSALSATHLKADLVPHTGCLGADTSNFRRFTDSSLRIQEFTASVRWKCRLSAAAARHLPRNDRLHAAAS